MFKKLKHRLSIRKLLFLLLILSISKSFADPYKEYDVKAAFIIKLIGFMSFPEDDSREKASDKLNFCIAGDNLAVERISLKLLADGSINKHFNYVDNNVFAECDVMFIPELSQAQLKELLLQLKSTHPILTFSDTPGYANQGVMINFYVEGQRIGFEINRTEMNALGFDISSRVLKLARIINE